jgi:hypothetical protein
MKNVKLYIAVCLMALAAACSQNAKDRLLGTGSSSEIGDGSSTNSASASDNQLMAKVAEDIRSEMTEPSGTGFPAVGVSSGSAGCTPGAVSASSTTYSIRPSVYQSSRTYTVGGVLYFAANNYQSSGGNLVVVTETNGSCFVNSSIYGTLSVDGSSYTQWFENGYQNKYRWYYYQYTYRYQGDVLVVEGKYTIGTETGSTVYPVKWTYPI